MEDRSCNDAIARTESFIKDIEQERQDKLEKLYNQRKRILISTIVLGCASIFFIDLNNIEDEQYREHVWASILEIAMQSNTNKFHNNIDTILEKLANNLLKIGIILLNHTFRFLL